MQKIRFKCHFCNISLCAVVFDT